jgi:hypothetical protein
MQLRVSHSFLPAMTAGVMAWALERCRVSPLAVKNKRDKYEDEKHPPVKHVAGHLFGKPARLDLIHISSAHGIKAGCRLGAMTNSFLEPVQERERKPRLQKVKKHTPFLQ